MEHRKKSSSRPPKPGTSKATPPRKKQKLDSSYPKITSFLSPSNSSKTETKFEPLNITVNKENRKKKHRSSRKTSHVVIPSFEKIIAERKKFDEHKESVKLLDVFDETLLDESLTKYRFSDEHRFSGELLDCKDLSFEQLEEFFLKNLTTLKEIMRGTVLSERHDCYYKVNTEESSVDLKTSNSIVVFSQKQNEYLLDLMTAKLDPENKMTSYFFKVLWPELCFRIFLDQHGMTPEEAKVYLDKRPLDIS